MKQSETIRFVRAAQRYRQHCIACGKSWANPRNSEQRHERLQSYAMAEDVDMLLSEVDRRGPTMRPAKMQNPHKSIQAPFQP